MMTSTKRTATRRRTSSLFFTTGMAALLGGGVLGLIIAAVIVSALLAVPGAWLLMLLVGVLHSMWPAVPAFGFWVCYVVLIIIRVLTHSRSVTTNTK